MIIQLKNIEASDTLGRNGTVWQATLHIEGVKVGMAYNYGDGGKTQWGSENENGRALIKQAEKWCKKQPPYTSTIPGEDNKPLVLPMNMELYLELQIDRHLEQKQLRNDMKRSIVYGVPDSGTWTRLRFKVPIAELLANKLYRGVLVSKLETEVFPHLGKGVVILNTNIPEQLHAPLGIKKDQIVGTKNEVVAKKNTIGKDDDLENRKNRQQKR